MSSWLCILITFLLFYFSSSLSKQMIEMRKMCNPEYRINTRLWLDFIKFSIERASDISQFLWRIYCERGVLTFECSTQARFLQTHLARVVHTDALYFKRWTRRYRRDAVYGFSGDLPRSCCTRSPKKTAPRTAPKYKGSRKKRRDERGPDRSEWPHAILNYFNEMG